MGSIMTIFPPAVILINNTNIIVIYLSLVVVFFLLGLILGLNIRTRRKIPKENKALDITDPVSKSRQTYVSGQDSRARTDPQVSPVSSDHKHSRHRHRRHSSIHIQ